MAYSKQTWVRGEKVASVKLNHMEDGIAAISANGAIDTANLAPAAVTNDKLDQEAVDSNNIRTGAIITPLIYDGAVTMPKLGADVIEELDHKADIDGSYESMTVGNAEQLVSSVGIEDQTPYNFRTSGGSTEIGDREELNAVVGVSVPWNQLALSPDIYEPTGATKTVSNGVITLTANSQGASNNRVRISTSNSDVVSPIGSHKYLVSAMIKPSISGTYASAYFGGNLTLTVANLTSGAWNTICGIKTAVNPTGRYLQIDVVGTGTAITEGDTVEIKNYQLFDLTAMFGSTIADYVYTLESGTAGAGIAWLKKYGWFTKPYYPYKAAALESVKTSAHKTYGFNAYNPSTGKAKVVGGMVYQITGAYTALSLDGTTITPDANGKFTPSANGTLTVTGGNSTTTCVHLVWDGERDGEYEPYEAHEYALSDITLRGILKLDANNNLYADGDRYLPDGTVERRYGEVDLGTLTWQGSDGGFSTVADASLNLKVDVKNAVCGKYRFNGNANGTSATAILNALADKEMASYSNEPQANRFVVKDSAYTDASTFKTAMSGIYFVYELATPTTETASPYQQTQIVDDFGTEEFVDAAVEANERDVAIPVGNETFYPQNLRKKIEGLPFDFSTLIARTEKKFKATKAYAVNEFMIINNQLYKVRTSIANGATITVGTNVIATTIGAELTAILNS